MAVPTFTLIVDLEQIAGTPVASAWVTIDTNFATDAIAFEGADGIRVVGGKHELRGGAAAYVLPVTEDPSANPTSFQYVITVDAAMPGVRPRMLGPIYVSGDEGDTVYLSDCMAATLVPASWRDEFRDELAAQVELVVSISEIDTTDDAVEAGFRIPGSKSGAYIEGRLDDLRASVAPQAWKTYTPTLSGITLGNGTRTGMYHEFANGLVAFSARVAFGSTTSVSGPISIGLPAPSARFISARCHATDLGVMWYDLFVLPLPTSVELWARQGNGGVMGIDSTTPFLWAVNDDIEVSGIYRKA